MFRSLFLLFLLVPMIEIYFLIKVGSVIGAGWTIFAVIGTAVLGAGLLRIQGLSTFQRAQATMANGEVPAVAMLEGVALALSGFLLLMPGFFTDTIGFLLLIPMLRQSLIKRAMKNNPFFYRSQTMRPHQTYNQSTIIEGEIVDDDSDKYIK
ncbi:hypothetical protein LCGC14_1920850 [marine sediment metagenome]|uniref:FxsA cytoplasmic membrane protein n=1 Tax=marine sediment metagenome TaxID=412755 RepID=A0A0F9INK4_9ZZZZ|nr:FxsA family protein [Methylophaga sp.]